jgi:hypothetical protein
MTSDSSPTSDQYRGDPVPLRYLFVMRHAKRRLPVGGSDDDPSTSNLQCIAASLRILTHRYASRDCTLDPFPKLTRKGYDETVAVIERLKNLKQEVKDTDDCFEFTSIIHPNNLDNARSGILGSESLQTAELVAQQWSSGKCKLIPDSWLNPENVFRHADFKKDGSLAMARRITTTVLDKANESRSNSESAVLIIGHEPLLGWISASLSGEAYPITNSEMLCFKLSPQKAAALAAQKRAKAKSDPNQPWRPCALLEWAISPPNEKTLEDLRDKIRAKMGIANLLSAFIAAGLGFLAANMADHDKIHWLSKQRPALIFSTLLLITALILYLTTMCSYDTLLMPIRFWGENPSQADDRPPWIVKRPPSSASWILYQNMVHVWSCQFIPATCCLITGLLTFMAAAFLNKAVPYNRAVSWVIVIVGAAFLVYVAYRKWPRGKSWQAKRRRSLTLSSVWRYRFGPWLGSAD